MSIASAIRELPVRADLRADGAPATPAKVAVCLGEWRLEAIIADGRWNRIYRATSAKSTGGLAQYAIKALHERFWDDPLSVARLRSEATVGRCVMHPHVVPVFASLAPTKLRRRLQLLPRSRRAQGRQGRSDAPERRDDCVRSEPTRPG